MATFRGVEDAEGRLYEVEDAYARTLAQDAKEDASVAAVEALTARAVASAATSKAEAATAKALTAEQAASGAAARVGALEVAPRIIEAGNAGEWSWRKYSDGRASCRWESNASHAYKASSSATGFSYCEQSFALPFAMMRCAAYGSDQNTRYCFANITGGATGAALSTDCKAVWFRVGAAVTVSTWRVLEVEGYYE